MWYAGYYTDGPSWLSIGRGPDSALIYSMLGEAIPFKIHQHKQYVTGRHEDASFIAWYDSSNGSFWATMYRLYADGREEYTDHRLMRVVRP